MLLSFIYKLIKLQKNHRHVVKKANYYQLPNSSDAYTFLQNIYLGDRLTDSSKQIIMEHELAHKHQWHSLDLLYFELLKIILWFHPIIYFLQKELRATHEYLADKEVVKVIEKSNYTNNLLNYLFESENISFVNSFFNQSLLKKRIQMLVRSTMYSSDSKRYLLLIPTILFIASLSLYISYTKDPRTQDNYRYFMTYGEQKITQATIKGCPIRTGNCIPNLTLKYIRENLSLETRNQLSILGPQMIVASFWIEEDGTVTDIKSFASILELSELAKTGITSLPPISPSSKEGIPFRTPYKYMIKFDLSKKI